MTSFPGALFVDSDDVAFHNKIAVLNIWYLTAMQLHCGECPTIKESGAPRQQNGQFECWHSNLPDPLQAGAHMPTGKTVNAR